MASPRIVVLVSGSGSNLQAIIDATTRGVIGGDVVAVVSDRSDAYGLERARRASIPAVVVEPVTGEARGDYDGRLAESVAPFEPDWIVLAGWMRLLSMKFLGRFPDSVVNLHPALPGELPGTRAIDRAWAEAIDGRRRSSGVMVHLVPDEGVDDGPVLGAATVAINTSGTREAFEASMHDAEHRLLVETLATLCPPSNISEEQP